MFPTVDIVVNGLLMYGYKDFGGSDVFRVLSNTQTGQVIKVFYDDYDNPSEIIIKESISVREAIRHINDEDIEHGSCIGE
jgi:hypothetical protein